MFGPPLKLAPWLPAGASGGFAKPGGDGSDEGMNPFAAWVNGQPWWVTLLLLPARVLAAVTARVIRLGLLGAVAVSAAALIAAAWTGRRRRRR